MRFEPVSLTYQNGQLCPARYFDVGSPSFVLLLPGLGYIADMPMLRAVRDTILASKRSVLTVDYDYRNVQGFSDLSDDEKIKYLERDGREFLTSSQKTIGKYPTAIAGKSLGTICMGGMDVQHSCSMIWLTPSLLGTGLLAKMASMQSRHFCAIGSEDPSINETRSEGFRQIPNLTHFEFAGMNHAWEHSKSSEAAALATRQLGDELCVWLSA